MSPTLVVDGDARPVGWADRERPGRVFALGSTFSPRVRHLARRAGLGADLAVRSWRWRSTPDTGRFAGVVSADAILDQVRDAPDVHRGVDLDSRSRDGPTSSNRWLRRDTEYPTSASPTTPAETEAEAAQTEQVESAEVDPVEAYAPTLAEAAAARSTATERQSRQGGSPPVSRCPEAQCRSDCRRHPSIERPESSSRGVAQPSSQLPADESARLTMGIGRRPGSQRRSSISPRFGRPAVNLDWAWIQRNLSMIGSLLVEHIILSVLPRPDRLGHLAAAGLPGLQDQEGRQRDLGVSRRDLLDPVSRPVRDDAAGPWHLDPQPGQYRRCLKHLLDRAAGAQRGRRPAFGAGCCEAIRHGRGLRLVAPAAPCRVAAGHAGDLRRSSCRHRVEHRLGERGSYDR